jgi:hypothetical protein
LQQLVDSALFRARRRVVHVEAEDELGLRRNDDVVGIGVSGFQPLVGRDRAETARAQRRFNLRP